MTETELSNGLAVDEDVPSQSEAITEEDVRAELRKFATAVGGPSVKEHKQSVASLVRLIKSAPEVFNDQYVKGVVKLAVSTAVKRFTHLPSFQSVHQLLEELSSFDRPTTVKALAMTIPALFPNLPHISVPLASRSVHPTKWLTRLASEDIDAPSKALVVAALASLAYYACGCAGAVKNFERNVKQLIKKWTMPVFVEHLKTFAAEPTNVLRAIALIAFIDKIDPSTMDLSSVFSDIFAKNVLLAKTVPPKHVLDSCHFSVEKLQHSVFKDTIVPQIKKSLLRSPEVALHGVVALLKCTFSLDEFVKEILNSAQGSLSSADDTVRGLAVDVAVSLAKASEPTGVKLVVDCLLAQAQSSKTVELRLSNLDGVARSAGTKSATGSALDAVADDVIGRAAKLVDSNEDTAVAGWKCVLEWSKRLTTVSPALETVFKESTKTPAAVRHAGYGTISEIVSARAITKLSPAIEKLFLTEVESNKKESLDLIGLGATLVQTIAPGTEAHSNLYNKLTSHDGYFKDKVLNSMSPALGIQFGTMVEKLILDRPTGQEYPLMCTRILGLLLFYPNHLVRKRAHVALNRVLAVEESNFAEFMAETLYRDIVDGWIDQTVHKLTHSHVVDSEWHVPGEWFVETVNTLLTPAGPQLESLAVHTLLIASVPRLVEVDGAVWLRWMHGLQTSGKAAWTEEQKFRDEVIDRVLRCKEKHIRDNALITLVALNVQSVRQELWKHVEQGLKALQPEEYTKLSDKEVAIFRTPEGTLYNMEALDVDEAEGMPRKKENKAYSYKEQLTEMQLRRELAAKARAEGKLTTKQKQAMEKELDKEKEIRSSLVDVYNRAAKALDEAKAMVNADPHGSFTRAHLLFQRCLPLTKSSLVCGEAAQLLLQYRTAAFPPTDNYLHELVGHCTMRLYGSKWKDAVWSAENLADALKRTFNFLSERAFVIDAGDDEDDDLLYEDMVGASEVLFLLPLLKSVLLDNHFDGITQSAITFLANAIHPKFLRDNSVLQLPLADYTSLLLSFIAKEDDDELRNPAIKALTSLINLVNESNDTGDEVQRTMKNLLGALVSDNALIRDTALKVLSAHQFIPRLVIAHHDTPFAAHTLVRLFTARFDPVESVASSASDLWLASVLHLKQFMLPLFIDECASSVPIARLTAAPSLAAYVDEFPDDIVKALDLLQKHYDELYDVKGAVFDEMGRMIQEAVDETPRRSGIAAAFASIASFADEKQAEQLLHVVVPKGLSDRDPTCRSSMITAALEVISLQGATITPRVLPVFEKLLAETPSTRTFDNQRQGLIVLIGTLAQYLDPKSEKIRSIVARLIESLSTPSQAVQEAVSRCLPPLVPGIKEGIDDLVAKLQHLLLNGSNYGERRGAAYGLAGVVKGLGMLSLVEFNLLKFISDNLESTEPKHREGALLALEILCNSVGRLFEPFMIKMIPSLLVCFGDSTNQVQEAARDTAKAMMASLTPYGTRLVMPALLEALGGSSSKTKCAAGELLGRMAHCAPTQLSTCLPLAVPKLIDLIYDSSLKVQSSGEKALKEIAKVIRNPEIMGIVPQIMKGLTNPAFETDSALRAVLNTKFIHYIDAPSLALIMPVLRRAFEEKNAETRQHAAQIISNMYNLTDPKDMEPYLPQLVPGVKRSLTDPVPEIRSVASKALGGIISKSQGATNERLRAELIPWLKELLVSTAMVDRSGAAQGLAEVLVGMGPEQIDFVIPEIIATTESTEVSFETRDGYLNMYIYLPMVFGEKFAPYLPQVIPPILKSLAVEHEQVRATALKAGQRLIAQYCSHARRLLLPELQRALFDENWRIRHAAVTLVGDFLFNVSGISGKSTSDTNDDDDTMGMEQASKQIIRALGQKSRDEVLSALFLARSDVALIVRQAASHVWKMIVSNTPRSVKEIMKTLFDMLVECLASSCEERQQMGARCLGELVRKMGEKILNEVLPVLEANQKSEETSKRVGVAVALHEIINNVNKDVLLHYFDQVVAPIRNALCDDEPQVRSEAAITFNKFFANVGNPALDEVLSPLLSELPDNQTALQGLCEVMKHNSKQILPYLLPRLTRPPINVAALCSLAAVAGDSLSRQLPRVLDALLDACKTNDENDPMIDSCEKVVIAVTDDEGVPLLLDYLMNKANKDNVPSAVLLHRFVEKTSVDLAEYVDDLFPGLLQLYTSTSPQIVDHAVLALIAVVKSVDAKSLTQLVPMARRHISSMVSGTKEQIPGLAHAKGLNPLVPMLREGVLQGGVETKELCGETLGQLVGLANATALKAHVVNVTGPLIRVLGDRYPPSVKLAILSTLSQLLDKVDAFLRPFFPQLQSTFLKSLQEPNSRQVRLAAAGALRRLLKIHPKPEPLFIDLLKVLAAQHDPALMETTFIAARCLLGSCIAKLTPPTVEEAFRVCALTYNTVLDTPTELDNSLTTVSGALLGEMALLSDQIDQHNIFSDIQGSSKPRVRLAKMVALQQMCSSDAKKVWSSHEEECRACIQFGVQGDAAISQAALRAAGYIMLSQEDDIDRSLLSVVVRGLNHQHVDVRRTVSVVIGNVLTARPKPFDNDVLKLVVPLLLNGTKETNTAVRCAAETALVHAFKLFENKEACDAYIATEKGAQKEGLVECYDRALKRLVKHNDYALESMQSIVAAP